LNPYPQLFAKRLRKHFMTFLRKESLELLKHS
jgi:hypothetical protein